MQCPHCGHRIADRAVAHHLAAKGGASCSTRKQQASRRNGQLGGRPPKRGVARAAVRGRRKAQRKGGQVA